MKYFDPIRIARVIIKCAARVSGKWQVANLGDGEDEEDRIDGEVTFLPPSLPLPPHPSLASSATPAFPTVI